MNWKPFTYSGRTYDLAHLHPRTLTFKRPSPVELYTVDVRFTLHCFSSGLKGKEVFDQGLVYPDKEERRLFDFRRYELSKRLPEIISQMQDRKPRQNGDHKYLTIELLEESGQRVEYDIFFKLTKKTKGRLDLLVETAFIRERGGSNKPRGGRAANWWIILHHTLHGIPIRP